MSPILSEIYSAKKVNEKLEPYLILVFGSRAKGTDRVDSDRDIAYLSHQKVEKYNRFMLGQELAAWIDKA
ncbi:nucleotidyltransferase domain-containing protein [Fictibacillus phosphorivorans]|uniref:nucleotidyltransferase domain-containing protein n=1 Tax=Fictibacillus phosphorivorans TaxID=1221500 RepID=UPI0009EF6B8B